MRETRADRPAPSLGPARPPRRRARPAALGIRAARPPCAPTPHAPRHRYKRISSFGSPGASRNVCVLYGGGVHYDALERLDGGREERIGSRF